jgi:hypothetical protein
VGRFQSWTTDRKEDRQKRKEGEEDEDEKRKNVMHASDISNP